MLLLGLCACGQQGAPEEPATNYFDMVWGWECPENAYAAYVDEIYHTESGTAGSAGKAAGSAVTLLAFSRAVAGDTVELTYFFEAMNDAQARFFASQWLRLLPLAREAVNDPAQFHAEYDWAGLEDYDAAQYSIEDVNALDHTIAYLLCREEMR